MHLLRAAPRVAGGVVGRDALGARAADVQTQGYGHTRAVLAVGAVDERGQRAWADRGGGTGRLFFWRRLARAPEAVAGVS